MSRKYTGDLAKPIRPRQLGLLADDEDKAAWFAEVTAEQERRMALLFAEYEIEPGDWAGLAWSLAFDHVPGMKLGKKTGRASIWGDAAGAILVLTVEETGLSISEAARQFAEQELWESITRDSDGVEQLRNVYHKHSGSYLLPIFRGHRDLMIEIGLIGSEPGEYALHYRKVITPE